MGRQDRHSIERRLRLARQQHEFDRRKVSYRGVASTVAEPSPRHRLELRAPRIFSVIQNPSETIYFLNLVHEKGRSTRVRIMFDDVEMLTADAAMALVATIDRTPGGKISGNRPKNAACRAVLEDSGFFEFVAHGYKLEESKSGRIRRRISNQVEGPIADDLIGFGTKALHGTIGPSEASYRVLVEAMQNTRDHAHHDRNQNPNRATREREKWWAMVYVDALRSRVCFAFLDSGVGIFRSAKLKGWRRAHRALRLVSDHQLLKDILERRIESRTGLSHRGKGLPSMCDLSRSGDIKEFTIVTNSSVGRVHNDTYEGLGSALHGALLYWEIE